MTPSLIARASGFSLAPGVLGAAMERVAPQVFLRPIGSPLTIGMSGLVIASLVQSGFDLRWIAESQATEVGLILLAVPFVLQLLASVFSYLARDGAGELRSACWPRRGRRWA